MEFEPVTNIMESFVPDLRIAMDGMLTSVPVTREHVIHNLGNLGALVRARHMQQEIRLGMRKPNDQPTFLGQLWLKDNGKPHEQKQVQTIYTTYVAGDLTTPQGEAVQDWFQSLSVV